MEAEPVSMSLICASLALASFGTHQVVSVTPVNDPVPGMTVIRTVPGQVSGDRLKTQDEPPQMPGWPKTTGRHVNFAPSRGVTMADLDGDGLKEILIANTQSQLMAWKLDGSLVPGFPKATTGFPQYPPSVADLDGDGAVEIVQTTRGFTNGGRLYVMDKNGNNLPGWPKSLSNNNVEYSATLADLDNDNQLEIIVGERAYPIGKLHVFEKDGTEWGGNWPVTIDHVPTQSATVGDVDGDGNKEVFYPSYNSMYLIKRDGTLMPGWPKSIAGANFSYQSAAMADLDGDGKLEIVTGAHGTNPGVHVYKYDGTIMPGWPKPTQTWTYCAPTVTDLEGDGNLEILDGQAGGGSNNPCFWVWNKTGQVRAGFPYMSSHGGGSEGPLTVADVDGDGIQEIYADHNYMVSNQGYLFGVSASGADLPGFPLRTNGFTYMSGATIGDVDNDGDYELCVVAYTDSVVTIYLYALPTQYKTSGLEWPTYHARSVRDGLFSPTATFAPDSFSVKRGVQTGGNLASLGSIDNDELLVKNGLILNQLEYPVTVEFDATSPRLAPASLELDATFRVSTVALAYVLDVYDFTVNTWDTIDVKAGPAPTVNTTFALTGSNVGRYVQAGTGKVRSRLRVKYPGLAVASSFTTRIDAVTWRVR